jgi:hypothetical protein
MMIECLESIVTFSASNDCLGWVVPLALALSGAVYWGGRWLYKHTVYRDDNFKLALINRLPNGVGDPVIYDPPSLKILPLHQLCHLFVEVKATRGFPLKSINFRCIALSDIGGSPVSSPVCVTNVIDEFNQDVMRPIRADGYNGIEFEYAEVRGLGKNRCIYYELYLDAKKEWSGTLSFKGRDPEGFCSYGRYAIEVKSPVPEIQISLNHPTTPELIDDSFESYHRKD